MKRSRTGKEIRTIALAGGLILVLSLVLGSLWIGNNARRDTESAVRSVSLFYLNELAGRRDQVVEANLQNYIRSIRTVISLMEESDLSDKEHLEHYQTRMKELFGLDRFAFIDEEGLIYTSTGTTNNIGDYHFDYKTISKPEIEVRTLENGEKNTVIAVPIEGVAFDGKSLPVCFIEIGMDRMLAGVSLETDDNNNTTFCNLYTSAGVPLTNMVLGGLSSDANLIDAMGRAKFEAGSSYEQMVQDFAEGNEGVASFSYSDIGETMYYVPVENTDWMLTYLIRESLISEQVSSVTSGIIVRSYLQMILIAIILLGMFSYIIGQMRKNSALILEKETAEAASRVRQEELEEKLFLQEKLLEEEKQKVEQGSLIKALSSDYKSVYYVDLDTDSGVCYQSHSEVDDGLKQGEKFWYRKAFTNYANTYVTEPFRKEFLDFIDPDAVREALKKDPVIAFRYLVNQKDREAYEMLRFAGVRRPEERDDGSVHAIGASFMDVDAETRKSMMENQALSDALSAANEANRAKTAFLSNMSHEIRTPMNAIIGLDNIALADPDLSDETRGHLEKIGESAQHLLNIINDILDMSRIESGRMTIRNEEFSFSKALSQVNTIIGGQCSDKGLHYECHVIGKVAEYYIGDDMKLRQVMINILGNAVKFTPAGGSVTFSVEEIAKFEGKTTLRFIMSDTGIGMSPEFLPKLFDAFSQEDSSTTSRYGSTGLGMPITKSIVELMNGKIDVQSEKGKGTTFTVTVTLGNSTQENETVEDDDQIVEMHGMNALIIDDDSVACEHAKLVLGQVGMNTDIALSGPEAIEMVKMREARREPYHLILVDWKMPGMDGVETTREIRKLTGHDTAIIILTSYNWDEIVEEATEAGVDTFVAKPLFASKVMDEFGAAFKKKLTARPKKKADLKGRRVLLAEDVAVNAEIMMMVLGMKEMSAEHAENGKIAVEMFENHPQGYYDAILMDMRMPEMDGLEATQTIRALDREDAKTIPIIALTANAFDEDVQRSMQAGLNAHLSKPVEPETLFETLESLIS